MYSQVFRVSTQWTACILRCKFGCKCPFCCQEVIFEEISWWQNNSPLTSSSSLVNTLTLRTIRWRKAYWDKNNNGKEYGRRQTVCDANIAQRKECFIWGPLVSRSIDRFWSNKHLTMGIYVCESTRSYSYSQKFSYARICVLNSTLYNMYEPIIGCVKLIFKLIFL